MDKTISEIHDCTRKALMDRIKELWLRISLTDCPINPDKKLLEAKCKQIREGLVEVMDRVTELERDKETLAEIGKEAQQMVLDLTDENNRLEGIIADLEVQSIHHPSNSHILGAYLAI